MRVGSSGGLGGLRASRSWPGRRRGHAQVRVFEREEGMARSGDPGVPGDTSEDALGQADQDRRTVVRFRRSAGRDLERHVQGPRLLARLDRVPRAARSRSPQASGADERAARAVADRDRDVEADGRSARLARQGHRLGRRRQGREGPARLGRVRPSRMGSVQARPYSSRVFELRVAVDPRRVVRGREEEARAHARGRRIAGDARLPHVDRRRDRSPIR
jgi:hypothetical protein